MKNIFITGGISGLGNALAQMFHRNGYRVGVCDIADKSEAENILSENIIYYHADVLDKENLAGAIRDFASHGSLDIVVANAGISMPKAKIPDFELGRKVIEINVIGALNTFEPAIAIMKRQRSGQLVAMGSIAGIIGLPGTAIYGASKSAIINLCESLEIDLHHYGIQVTAIAPGFIDTPLTKNNKHKMPFLMPQEKAVRLIYDAVIKKKGLSVFPFPLMVISRILYHLPRGFYKYFMKKDHLGLARD